ncbi:MAG TPA: hypothetical protein VFL76_05760 [Edaphocola sp.]|nr:hypothetical protein [Edaphocola sp.]
MEDASGISNTKSFRRPLKFHGSRYIVLEKTNLKARLKYECVYARHKKPVPVKVKKNNPIMVSRPKHEKKYFPLLLSIQLFLATNKFTKD